MTGLGASYGKRMKQAFELAIDDAKRTPGAPAIELLVEDFQWDTGKALTAYRKLTGVDGVKIIVGITGSRNATPVTQASKSDDVVIIDALTSSPTLTRRAGPNYFRVMASDALAGRFNAQWATGSGMTRGAVVYVEDEWGVSYRDELKRYLSESGVSLATEQGCPAGARDYRAQIARLKEANVDTVFVLLYPPDGGVFMQQARQEGVTAIAYGSDNLSAPEFAAPGPGIIEGVRLALPAAVAGASYEGFKARYQKAYGEEADSIAAKSYDAMSVAIDAARRAGNNPAAIRAILRAPGYSFQGLTGSLAFDANGDLTSQQYSKMVYRKGQLVPFESSTAR
jgi:branched-chain amino acid transport system substrate-binding protein